MNTGLLNALKGLQPAMEQHFTHLHRYPELAFEEEKTAAYLAEKLRGFGYEVHEKIGKTGVVARMRHGDGKASIGLRSDIDALPIQEMNNLPYKSTTDGKAHLCGHDGHMTMLLGAAEYLAAHKPFNGTLNLIFQPAEEIMGGALAMMGDGLLERFPMDNIFGLHNIPTLEKGHLYLAAGPLLTAVDNWEIELTGRGSHGSMPEKSLDPVVAGSALVMALQTVVSRNVGAQERAVVSVGAFQAGDAGNIIPQTALLRLSIRTAQPHIRELVLQRIRRIAQSTAETYEMTVDIREGQPGTVLVNDAGHTQICETIAGNLLGADKVHKAPPLMASDDFAFYADKIPGVYAYIGNGNTPMVHHPEYAFDRDILSVGAAYWVAIAQHYLK